MCVCIRSGCECVSEWGPRCIRKEQCGGERGQRWTHSNVGLTHPWKRGRDPYCTQTAFQSGRDMERVSAYLPQSSMDMTGNMRELSRLAIEDKH